MLAGDAGYRPAILDDHGAVLEGRQSDAFASLVGVLSAASLTRAHSPTGCEWVCIPLTIARAGVLRSSPLKKRITLADTPELLRSPGLTRRDSGIEGHRQSQAATIVAIQNRLVRPDRRRNGVDPESIWRTVSHTSEPEIEWSKRCA